MTANFRSEEGGRGPDLFSGAEAYERFMGRWSRDLAPLLVQFAGVRDGETILDVGSGTGALSAAVVSAAPASHIVGIDPSPAYVAFAGLKATNDRMRFEVGDAQHIQFADASFDRAFSLLAINFVPDPQKAVLEMRRVTRPGGAIAAAVWDYGEGMEMLRAFWDTAIALDAAAEKKDERHMPLCRSGDLTALWSSQGLQDVEEEPLTIHTRFTSFDDYWAPFMEKQAPAGAYVGGLPPSAREELMLRLQRRLSGDRLDQAFVLNARAWAVRGSVP